MSYSPYPDRDPLQSNAPWRPKALIAVDYSQALSAVFEDTSWVVSTTIGGAIVLVALFFAWRVPYVGYLTIPFVLGIFDGFAAALTVASLESDGKSTRLFEFNRIGDYFARATGKIALNFLLLVAWTILVVMHRLAAAAIPVEIAGAVYLVRFVATLGLFAIYLALSPISLKVGLTGDASDALDFRWHVDFVSRMWREMLLGAAQSFFVVVVATFFGFLFFVVGLLGVYPFLTLYRAHFNAQLYRAYLTRGGGPVVLKLSFDRFSYPTGRKH